MRESEDSIKMESPYHALSEIKHNKTLTGMERRRAFNLIIKNMHQDAFREFCMKKLHTKAERERMLKKAEGEPDLAFRCFQHMVNLTEDEDRLLVRALLYDAHWGFEYISNYKHTADDRKKAFTRIYWDPNLCIKTLKEIPLSLEEKKQILKGISMDSYASGVLLVDFPSEVGEERKKYFDKMIEHPYPIVNFLEKGGCWINDEEKTKIFDVLLSDKDRCFNFFNEKKHLLPFEIMKAALDLYGLDYLKKCYKDRGMPFKWFNEHCGQYMDDNNKTKYINYILKKKWYKVAVEVRNLINDGKFILNDFLLEDKVDALIVEGKLLGTV